MESIRHLVAPTHETFMGKWFVHALWHRVSSLWSLWFSWMQVNLEVEWIGFSWKWTESIICMHELELILWTGCQASGRYGWILLLNNKAEALIYYNDKHPIHDETKRICIEYGIKYCGMALQSLYFVWWNISVISAQSCRYFIQSFSLTAGMCAMPIQLLSSLNISLVLLYHQYNV